LARPGRRGVSQAGLRERNFKVAVLLLGWVALLALASLIVIWMRN
jgi:hypothetical protein